jgi:hypothetical protein
VLNVAGHRLGTMEIESALVAHARVAEAAVVGKPHEIKGESVFAFVVTRGARPTGDTGALVKELREWVAQQLGPIAKPDDIRFADNLPKTRSGKIMRRLLKAIARGEEITQDVSTLENPAILEQLRGTHTSASAAPASVTAPAAATKKKAKAARKSAAGGKPARKPAAKKARGVRRAAPRRAPARRAPKRAAAKKSVRRGAGTRGGRAAGKRTRRASSGARRR